MNREKLEDIIELQNAKKIDSAIKQEGFFDMATHPTLKKVSLVPIARSENLIKTDWLYSKKFAFMASFTGKVNEYPNLSFIWLQINKYDRRLDMFIPHFLTVYAKENN